MHVRVIFQRLGLPKHADALYTLLQRKGPMVATGICRAGKLHRPAVYRALDALRSRHFVFVTKQGQRAVYHAANPKSIAAAFTHTAADAAASVAKLAIADDAYRAREIRFLHGFNGVRAAFDDVIAHLKHGETFYRYTSERDLDAVNRYLSKDYRLHRDRKKLERMVISNPLSGARKKPRLERFIKYIPERVSLFDQNIIQLVYGKRVSLIDLNTERVVILENAALADFQKVIFRQLYDKLLLT